MRTLITLLLVSASLLAQTDNLGTLTVGDSSEEQYLRTEGFLEGAAAQKTLSTQESLGVPGAAGDPIKGLSSLAGIVTLSDMSGELVIHGTRPRESRVVYNRLPVGFLYHWGGLFSTVPPEAIEQIDAYLGGFDAGYGNALGAVIDITPRYPTGRNGGFVHGGLYNASFGYDFKISDQANGFVGARRSYVDLIVDPDSLSVEKTTVSQVPRFWDTTAIVAGYHGDHLFTLEAFAGLDELEINTQDMIERDPAATGTIDVANGYASLGARWIYSRPDYTADTLLFYSRTRIDTGFFDNRIDFVNHTTGLNHKSTLMLSDRRVQWGFEAISDRLPIRYDGFIPGSSEGQSTSLSGRDRTNIDRTVTEERYGLFVQEIVPLTSAWALRYGIRGDYGSFGRYDWEPAPRASIVWNATNRDRFALSAGRYTQIAEGFKNTRELGSENLGWEKADHLVLAYTRQLDPFTEISVEPYVKRFFDLAVYDPDTRYKSTGKGESTGVDITYKRRMDGDWMLMGTYSYVSAKRDTNTTSGLQPFYGEVPHVAQLIGSKRFKNGWELGLRALYHTGERYTPLVRGSDGKNYTTVTAPGGTVYKQPNYGEPFSQRLPDYLGVNLRLSKTRRLHGGDRLEMSFELMNLFMRDNPSGIDYDDEYEKEAYFTQSPFMPWFDLTWRF